MRIGNNIPQLKHSSLNRKNTWTLKIWTVINSFLEAKEALYILYLHHNTDTQVIYLVVKKTRLPPNNLYATQIQDQCKHINLCRSHRVNLW